MSSRDLLTRQNDSLQQLGLTPAEAEVYTFLLQESPATGYRIAQAIGRPVSNIYKSIESLEAKGAILIADDESHRAARAVPIAEFTARLRARLEAACAEAAEQLEAESEPAPDDLLYRLNDREQALERIRSMLRSADQFAVATIGPSLVEALRDDLIDAARRLPLAIKVFRPVEIPRAEVILDPRGESAVIAGPGEWCALSVDGREFLQVLFDGADGSLLTGHWTTNPLLAWSTYTGICSDLILAQARAALASGNSPELILNLLESPRAFERSDSAGKGVLVERFRRPSPARRKPRGA